MTVSVPTAEAFALSNRRRRSLLAGTAMGVSLALMPAAVGAQSISQTSASGDPITINAGSISTTSDGDHAVRAQTDGTITITATWLTTSGLAAFGIKADGGAGAISITSGTVNTSGNGSAGILAQTTSGDITISADITRGTGTAYLDPCANTLICTSEGIIALSQTGDVSITSNEASTIGALATAVYAQGASATVVSGTASNVGGGGSVIGVGADASTGNASLTSTTFTGGGGIGVLATSAEGTATIQSGSISMTAPLSLGIYAVGAAGASVFSTSVSTGGTAILADSTDGPASVVSGSASTVNRTGIYATAGNGGSVSVDSDSVSVSATGGWGIYTATTGAITITSDSITTAAGAIPISQTDPTLQMNSAIRAAGGTGDVSITSGTITSSGSGTLGIHATTTSGNISIVSDESSSTALNMAGPDLFNDNILAMSDTGNISVTSVTGSNASYAGSVVSAIGQNVTIDSTSATTTGNNGVALYGATSTGSTGNVSITSGTISLGGDSSAITAISGGTADIDSGTITANLGLGIYASAAGDILINSDAVTSRYSSIVGESGGGSVSVVSGSVASEWRTGIYTTAATGITIDSGSVDISPFGGWGIYAKSDGPIAIVSDSVVNDAPGFDGHGSAGIYVDAGAGAVAIDSGNVATSGFRGFGIHVEGDAGDVTLTSDSVSTSGDGAPAIVVQTTSGDITIDAGVTKATGTVYDEVNQWGSEGVLGLSGTGNVSITSNNASTTGLYSSAVYGQGASVTVISGTASNVGGTNGVIGVGAKAFTGDAVAQSTTFTGIGGLGLYASADVGTATVKSGSISMTGGGSVGIYSLGAAGAFVEAGSVSTVATSIYAASASGPVSITTSGDITSSAASAIRIGNSPTATIIVGKDSTISGAEWTHSSGAIKAGAIHTESSADLVKNLGTINGNSNLGVEADVLENAGTINGTFALGAGNDTAILLAGSSLAGLLDGGDDVDTLKLNGSGNQTLGPVANFENLDIETGIWSAAGQTSFGAIDISGGTLLVTGSLTGDVTTAAGGVFQLGDGGTVGSFTGNLVNDGTFLFNQSDDYGFNGAFSGTGTLIKDGAGTLTFNGAYNFTGTTQLLAGLVKIAGAINPETEFELGDGTLELEGDQTIGGLEGPGESEVVLEGGAALTVNQDEDTVFAGAIQGDGALTKSGDGLLNLTGDSTYTGPTTVDGGTLAVNGSIQSPVTVNDGGTLGGTGTLSHATISDGGTFAPGNSIGTIVVDGDLTFADGSIFEVEVNAAGQNDKVVATGNAAINGGVVQVLAENGNYANLQGYTILTTGDGVTGRFDSVSTDLAFLTPSLVYSPQSVHLVMIRNDRGMSSVAVTRAQSALARSLEVLNQQDPLVQAVLGQNVKGARTAFDSLSGRQHGSLATSLLALAPRTIRLPRSGSGRRGLSFWGEGGSFADAQAGQVSLDRRELQQLPAFRSGITLNGGAFEASFGGGRTGVERLASGADSSSSADTGYFGANLSYRSGGFTLSGAAAFSHHDIATSRSVIFPHFADAASAKLDASTRTLSAEIAYALPVGVFELQPYASYSSIGLSIDGFDEVGGPAALSVAKQDRRIGYGLVGFRAAGAMKLASIGRLVPRADIAWQHASGDLLGTATATFRGGGQSFLSEGMALSSKALRLNSGLDLEIGSLKVGAEYRRTFDKSWNDHSGAISFGLKF